MTDEKQDVALAKREEKPELTVGRPVGGLAPRNVEEMFRMANAIAKSGMAPKGLDRPEQVFVALQMGAEIGLAPMQAVQNIAVINGRPSVWGDAMLGIVEASGLLADFHEEAIEDKGQVVGFRCTALRRGRSKAVVRTFMLEDAKRAGLAGKAGPWSQYPQRMLQMRARSWALRDGFPDALRGLLAREEAADCVETTATVVDAKPDPFAPGRHSARPKPPPEPEPEKFDPEAQAKFDGEVEEANKELVQARADAVQEIEAFMLSADAEQGKVLTAAFKRAGVTNPGDADDEALDALQGTVRDLQAQ